MDLHQFLAQFGSVSGIVAATIFVVEGLKRKLGNRRWFGALPTWVYACLVSLLLTVGARYFGLLHEARALGEVLFEAVFMAASASGFWTWWQEPNDQLRDSAPAMQRRP